MKKILVSILILGVSLFADTVYSKTYNESAELVYPKLIKAFDNAHLIVVSEIDILTKFKKAGLPKMFGKNFNTNELTTIKAIIACNGFFGNEIANADPKMMAFCPVRVTVIEKDGKTTVMYVQPQISANESKASAILEKLSSKVIKTINSL